jgi:hypothetical protein
MKLTSERFFYRVFLPIAVGINLGLGILVLSDLNPQDWRKVLVIGTGAFCCFVAGSLASAAWTKSYLGDTMARQIATWRQIADAIFSWLEEAPLPAEALHRLKRSLDEVVPGGVVEDSAAAGRRPELVDASLERA